MSSPNPYIAIGISTAALAVAIGREVLNYFHRSRQTNPKLRIEMQHHGGDNVSVTAAVVNSGRVPAVVNFWAFALLQPKRIRGKRLRKGRGMWSALMSSTEDVPAQFTLNPGERRFVTLKGDSFREFAGEPMANGMWQVALVYQANGQPEWLLSDPIRMPQG